MLYAEKSAIIFSLPAVMGTHTPTLPAINRFYHPPVGVKPIMQRLYQQGYVSFIVANIPEFHTENVHRSVLIEYFKIWAEKCFDMPIHIRDIYVEVNPNSRRYLPSPTMVREIIADHRLRRSDVLMVGRSPIDHKASVDAGVDYFPASKFFSTTVPKRK